VGNCIKKTFYNEYTKCVSCKRHLENFWGIRKIVLIDMYIVDGCARGLYLEIVLLGGKNFRGLTTARYALCGHKPLCAFC